MKTTWTFYPKHEGPVTIIIKHEAKLDAHQLPSGGFYYQPYNTALVDTATLRIFTEGDVYRKEAAFGRLVRILKANVKVGDDFFSLGDDILKISLSYVKNLYSEYEYLDNYLQVWKSVDGFPRWSPLISIENTLEETITKEVHKGASIFRFKLKHKETGEFLCREFLKERLVEGLY